VELLRRSPVPAVRALLGRPRRSLLVVVILALGIGLSTALFSVLDGVALRGLPFPDGDRIVFASTGRSPDVPTPVTDIRKLRAGLDGGGDREVRGPFAEVAAFRTFNTVITRPGVGSKGLTATYVTGNLFRMLGTEPVLGRGFTAEDENPTRPAVAVISHGVWRSQFGGRQDVLGETVVVNREPMTVVGVMPRGFGFPVRQEAWAALRWEGRPWSGSPALMVAKLRRGWTAAGAQRALAPVAARLDGEDPLPEAREAHVQPYVETLLPPEIGRSLRLMLWAALGLLLVASANAASLRLASALARRHEFSVRRALGAGTGRLLRLHMAEAAVLAGAAAVAGIALAWALVELASTALLRGSPLVSQFWVDVRLDWRSGLFAAGTAVVALLVGGLLPAVAALRRRDLALGTGAPGRATQGPGASRLAGGLVAVQVALAFALMAGSGLLARSGLGLLERRPAFAPEHLARVVVSGYQAELDTPAERSAFWDELFRRLDADPEVAGATLASDAPWQEGIPAAVRRDPTDPAELDSLPGAALLEVLPGFFDTLRLPLLAGRTLVPEDAPGPAAPAGGEEARASAELPAVVSASLARDLLGSSPLGATFEAVPYWSRRPVRVRVVGVAADLGLGRSDRPGSENSVFVPASAAERSGGILVVRGRRGTAGLERSVERAVAAANPLVATLDFETFAEGFAEETWVERRLAQVVSLFAASALALAALGLFATIALALEARARELAVRSALGARPRQLGGLLLRTGSLQVAAGIGLGAALLGAAGRFLRPFLYRVEPWDPAILALAAAAVGAAFAAALAAPALRAGRTDPVEALRAEGAVNGRRRQARGRSRAG
jgi:predicted permease